LEHVDIVERGGILEPPRAIPLRLEPLSGRKTHLTNIRNNLPTPPNIT
jgi:hypothetical protein